MEWNMILAILFFLIGTILMPLGLKQIGRKKYLLIGAAILSDLIGVLVLFN